MAVTTTQIRDFLRPGIAGIFGDYADYPAMWKDIYEKKSSDKAWENIIEIRLLGMASVFSEGQSVPFDNGMGERFQTIFTNRYVGLGYIITRQAIKDNLYKSWWPSYTKSLKSSFLQTKETLGAAWLNNGFSGTAPYQTGDGQAIFDTDHPIDTGTVANTFTAQADLNETSLLEAVVGIQAFRDAAGLLKMVQPRKLIVPPALQWTAERLTRSQYTPGSANNAVNPIVTMSVVPDGFRVNQFLTDSNAWFVKTNAEEAFIYFEREPMEINTDTTFDNENLKVKGLERYVFGVADFRGMWGSQGAS